MDVNEITEYKVVTVGEQGVGKTSLVKRFSEGVFNEGTATTIGAAYVKVNITVQNTPVCLNIWDTAGQERFQSLIPLYLRSAQACIIVVDLSQKEVISNLNTLFDHIKDILPSDVSVVLAGNKKDLVPELDESQLMMWAEKNRMSCIFTSAKSGENVDLLFKEVATLVKNNHISLREDSNCYSLAGSEHSSTSKCC